MSFLPLRNKNCWVVGGVGVIGRSITQSLLKAGATVIINSREEFRLERLSSDLGNPDNLVTIRGSLLPGASEKTVASVLADGFPLHHVVAHGAVRYWNTPTGTPLNASNHNHNHNHESIMDETYSLDRRRLMDMNDEEFKNASGQLASLHFSAARALLPRLEGLSDSIGEETSYTFVTGHGGGHPSNIRSAAGDLNAHHVWGLSAAMRSELKGQSSKVVCREIRVGIPVNRPEEKRLVEPRSRPISRDIGDLCAGLVTSGGEMNGGLLEVNSEASLKKYLDDFNTRGTGADADELQLQDNITM